jgi:ketosteroid isomerase-like protein
MPGSETNVALVQAAYEAMTTGDVAWLQEHTHPDVVFQQGGRFPTAGTFAGRDAMFGHMMEFLAMVEGRFSLAPRDFMASDDRVAVLLTVTVGVGGRELAFDELHVFTVSDGLVVDMRAIPLDPYAVDEFFAGAAASSS